MTSAHSGTALSLVIAMSLVGSLAAAGDHYDLSALRTLSDVVVHLKNDYAEPSRVKPQTLLVRALEAASRAEPRIHVRVTATDAKLAIAGAEESFPLATMDSLWKVTFTLKDAAEFVSDHLPKEMGNADLRGIEAAMIDGMLGTLDDQSRLLRAEEAKKLLRLKDSTVLIDRESCFKLYDLKDGTVLKLRVKRDACPK